MTKFFDMNLVSGRSSGTAAAMFDSFDAHFTKHGLDWDNVSGIGVDNTIANISNYYSLKTGVLNTRWLLLGAHATFFMLLVKLQMRLQLLRVLMWNVTE